MRMKTTKAEMSTETVFSPVAQVGWERHDKNLIILGRGFDLCSFLGDLWICTHKHTLSLTKLHCL